MVYNGDRRFEDSNNSTEFTVSKKDMKDLTVIDLGNGTVKIVTLPCDATGNVTVTVGNNTYTGEIINGIVTVDLDEPAGVHNITVTYPGDVKYNEFEKNDTIVIHKCDTPISVSADNIYVGDDAEITVNVPLGVTGEITLEIEGVEFTAPVKDGKAQFTVPDLKEGTKIISVKYPGDNKYLGNFTIGEFNVSKRPSKTSISVKDIVYGDDAVIYVTVTDGATGNVTIVVDSVVYDAEIVDGVAKVVIPDLKVGNHKITATYGGDDKFLPSNATSSFKVSKAQTALEIDNDSIPVGKDATVVVHLPGDATGTVTIKVNNKVYTAPVKNGKAVFKIPGLPIGNHTVYASYSGDDKYDACDILGWVNVYGGSYPPVNPDNPEIHNDVPGESSGIPVSSGKGQTGNPILALLLVFSILGISIKRKK